MKDSEKMESFQRSLLEDSHVPTFPLRVKQKESTEKNRDCSLTLCGSFAQLDQDSSSWKTFQRCLQGDWELYLESFPRSGMTVSGIAYRLPVLVPLMRGTESGLWATPVAHNAQEMGSPSDYLRNSPPLTCEAIVGKPFRSWTEEDLSNQKRGKLNPEWCEFLMGYPVGWTDLDNLETA